MKKLIFLLLVPFYISAQDYVDVFRIHYGVTLPSNFEGTNESTDINGFEINFTYPVIFNENNVLITGADFNSHSLILFPEETINTHLYSSTFKLGLATTYSDKYSSTIVLLPKFASDYINLSFDDFYFGGFAAFKIKKKENLIYRFGIYTTTEAFGQVLTPMAGLYYKSTNNRFELDASLPFLVDMNYKLGNTMVGLDYFGLSRSYKLHQEGMPAVYIEQSPLEFSGYIQFHALEKSVLLRAKVGYSTNNYEVYNIDDTIDIMFMGIEIGGDRTMLNPEIEGNVFFRLEMIYRFYLLSDNEKK